MNKNQYQTDIILDMVLTIRAQASDALAIPDKCPSCGEDLPCLPIHCENCLEEIEGKHMIDRELERQFEETVNGSEWSFCNSKRKIIEECSDNWQGDQAKAFYSDMQFAFNLLRD